MANPQKSQKSKKQPTAINSTPECKVTLIHCGVGARMDEWKKSPRQDLVYDKGTD